MASVFSSSDLDAALAAQLGVRAVWEACGESVGGWKVAFTTGANRSVFDDAEYRPFGMVLANRILASGTAMPRADVQVCQLEPELALVVGERLQGAVTPEAARAAVSGVAPAFEINEIFRSKRVTPLPVRVAGGMNNWGMVIGDPIAPPDWDVRTTTVEMVCSTGESTTAVMEEGEMDDPYVSLSRLARRLDRFGLAVEPGTRVLTGAFSHHRVNAGETWTATFSGIGSVSITFD